MSSKSILPKKVKRHGDILDLLKLNPTMRVHELAENLAVSAETIRRDLNALDNSGEINRTYGGAIRSSSFEPALNERLSLNLEQKRRIVNKAVATISDNDVIIIGGGATCLHLTRAIRDSAKRITVITPSLHVAMELGSVAGIETILPPGSYNGHEAMVVGHETISYLSQYHVNAIYLGASGISVHGISEAVTEPSQVYRAMTGLTDKVYIMADHTKFAKRALSPVCQWHDKVTLISDTALPADITESLDKAQAQFILAE